MSKEPKKDVGMDLATIGCLLWFLCMLLMAAYVIGESVVY